MLKTILIISLAALPAFSQDAYLNKYKPKTEVFDSQNKAIEIKKDLPLYEGYTVTTKEKSECEIIFKDKSVVFLSENSKIVIEKAENNSEKRDFSLNFLKGKMLFFVNKLKQKTNSFKIKTPTAVCAVRGTEFALLADKEKTNVGLFEGALDVQTSSQTVSMKPNTEAEIKEIVTVSDRLSSLMLKEKARAEKLRKYVEGVREKLEKRNKKIEERGRKTREKLDNFLNKK